MKKHSLENQKATYVYCNLCKVKLNIKNVDKHKNRCIKKNKIINKSIIIAKKDKINEVNPSLYIDEYEENKRLDGSRDYWELREYGKFGSHPSFDDMSDESFS